MQSPARLATFMTRAEGASSGSRKLASATATHLPGVGFSEDPDLGVWSAVGTHKTLLWLLTKQATVAAVTESRSLGWNE